MVVFASGELKKIQECCNCVDNLEAHIVFFMHTMRYRPTVLSDFRMDIGGKKDLCLFREWAYEYFGTYRQNGPFYHHGSVAQNAGS